MEIKSSERVTIVGKTGSGKSVLVRKLSEQFKKVIFVDPKCENAQHFPYATKCTTVKEVFEKVDESLENKEDFFILYQPLDLSEEVFNNFCGEVFLRGNMTIFMDEVSFVCFPQATINHQRIIRMGRSKGIGIHHLTQRPKFVDNFILSEAEHFFIFRLQLVDDRKKIEGIIGEDLDEHMERMDKFEFLYYNAETGVKHFEPVKI